MFYNLEKITKKHCHYQMSPKCSNNWSVVVWVKERV